MQGVSEFRHQPGVRRLPRPGATGGSPGLSRLPGLRARRSRRGAGRGERSARMRPGWGVTFVPFFAAARTLLGRFMPVRERIALRPAARSFLAPPKGATRCGVQPHYSAGAPWRPCLRPAGNRPYAPSRGAGKAAAYSRLALPLRRAGVVSTSEAGTDDAGNVTSYKVEVRISGHNGHTTRHFSTIRKVATCLPNDQQVKRLTQRRNVARQGRQAYPQRGKTGSYSALPTSATASADLQIRAIFTNLTEVSGTHA